MTSSLLFGKNRSQRYTRQAGVAVKMHLSSLLLAMQFFLMVVVLHRVAAVVAHNSLMCAPVFLHLVRELLM